MMLLTNISAPDEGIHHKQEETQAFIDGKEVGNGALFITESEVSWLNTGGQGFGLQYPNISLHAVSRDTSAFPHECLYLMVEGKLIEEEKAEDDDEDEDDYDCPTTEVRFVPSDKGALDAMFTAMSDCQTLHPDPDDTDSDADDGQYYEGQDGVGALTEQGQATLQRLEHMLQAGQGDNPVPNGHVQSAEDETMETGQFDDADNADMEQ